MGDLSTEAAGFCHTSKAVLALFSVLYSEFLQFLKEILADFKGVNDLSNKNALRRFKLRFAISFVVYYLILNRVNV